jgi:hypothetical protein
MTDTKLPFSFPVEVLQLPAAGRVYTLQADERARADIAALLGLVAVGRLIATITIAPMAGGGVEARARFDADVTQTCVVSLEPLPATVGETIVRRFKVPPRKAPSSPVGKPPKVTDVPPDGWIDPDDDTPDPIIEGCIDLGALVVEELALALDPYPRTPGISFAGPGDSAPPEAGGLSSSPFAALAGFQGARPTQRRSKTRPKVRR